MDCLTVAFALRLLVGFVNGRHPIRGKRREKLEYLCPHPLSGHSFGNGYAL